LEEPLLGAGFIVDFSMIWVMLSEKFGPLARPSW
jgi:hypothetical protein